MRRALAAAFLILLVVAPVGHAQQAAFDLTPQSFLKTLNWYLLQRNGDKIKSCATTSNAVTCRFTSNRFRHLARVLRRVEGGHQALKQTLAIRLQTENKKISAIALAGDRSDPVNMLQFMATLGNIMRVFDPTLSDDEAFATARALGVAEGGAPASGRMARPYASIACAPTAGGHPSATTCVLTPRL